MDEAVIGGSVRFRFVKPLARLLEIGIRGGDVEKDDELEVEGNEGFRGGKRLEERTPWTIERLSSSNSRPTQRLSISKMRKALYPGPSS